MSSRPYNFSAGPAVLPVEVLEQAAAEMLDWRGCGMNVMEMSHRGKEFGIILAGAQQDLRDLLEIPDHFQILFMQGGGLAENAIVPMNLCGATPQSSIDVVVTGAWSAKSLQEARRYAPVAVVADAAESGYTRLPEISSWRLSQDSSYVHLCSNETIHGVQFEQLPELTALGVDAPLVVDCSSDILSRPMQWSKVGLAYAGAQKNIGPAGLTLVVVREDLLDRAMTVCPSAFHYQTVAQHGSMFNTPPTYAIYIAGLVFQWLKRQKEGGLTGVAAMEERNRRKAQALYGYIDTSHFYQNKVQSSARSRMNVPFFLNNEQLNDAFLEQAQQVGLRQLKGHKSVGGMRASLYNAMPEAGVAALIEFMRNFARQHG
jgi:phosphoserine aminotransferase